MSSARICFLLNPVAGMGGPLALKGTDGWARWEALRRGAKPVSPARAERFLREAARLGLAERVTLVTPTDPMGGGLAARLGFRVEAVTLVAEPTSPGDTFEHVARCTRANCDIVVVVGGDGTARDAALALLAYSPRTPLLGVPAGVKVYSSVFAETPEAAAHVLLEWLESRRTCMGEIVDIDEEAFRRGVLATRMHAAVPTPCSSLMVGSSKQPTPASEREQQRAIAKHVVEYYVEPCTLLILGPGSTVAAVAEELGVEKTLLGVDAVHCSRDGCRVLAEDADEETLLRLVVDHRKRGGRVLIILSPIGGQGYILGRGNQQISPRVLREAGVPSSGRLIEGILVVATPSKMARLGGRLRVDTGDPRLDAKLRGRLVRVVVGYMEEQLARIT